MNQSTWLHESKSLHAAVVMDGNGRWAESRGLSRSEGHRAGVAAARRIVEAAPSLGISVLTLFAFSCENWKRPREEVRGLFDLLRTYFTKDLGDLDARSVRLSVIGRRDRLPPDLVRRIVRAEARCAGGEGLLLRIALDYGGRDAIARAAAEASWRGPVTVESISEGMGPDVDLLVRTGGEQRLSGFLIWECAYAELFFTRTLWPDFTPEELSATVRAFSGRERRFGGLGVLPSVPRPGRPAEKEAVR